MKTITFLVKNLIYAISMILLIPTIIMIFVAELLYSLHEKLELFCKKL